MLKRRKVVQYWRTKQQISRRNQELTRKAEVKAWIQTLIPHWLGLKP